MLDIIIRKHVDKMEDIEVEAKSDIEKILKAVTIDEFVDNTENVMSDIVHDIKALITEKYSEKAVREGLAFSAKINDLIKKDKEIKVPDTENPTCRKAST